MTQYYGDFAEDDTVLIPFNTFSSNDPSASVTITNLADADLKVHKDGSITQAVIDGATVVIDFDGITGNHMVTIDTSADAFYVTGSEYAVRMEGTTVDGATINSWIGAFSIERAGGVLALIKAGNLSANVVQLGGVTQSLTDLKDFADAGYDPVTNKVQGVVLVDTTTTNTDMRGTDSAATEAKQDIIDTNIDQIETAVITNAAGTDIADDIIAVKTRVDLLATQSSVNTVDIVVDAIKAETALIVADTNELQTDDVPGLIAALNDAPAVSVADILTTQMTEAFAADGVAPTLAQALFLIQQILGDFGIAGTTLTVRKIDGVTTAATFTLDDGTNPTDLTRAT